MMLIQHHKASEYCDRAIDQFEQIYADAEDSARVMALVVHPYIMGAPHRLKYFRKIFAQIRQKPDVAFMTGEQIFDWYTKSDRRRRNTPVTSLKAPWRRRMLFAFPATPGNEERHAREVTMKRITMGVVVSVAVMAATAAHAQAPSWAVPDEKQALPLEMGRRRRARLGQPHEAARRCSTR